MGRGRLTLPCSVAPLSLSNVLRVLLAVRCCLLYEVKLACPPRDHVLGVGWSRSRQGLTSECVCSNCNLACFQDMVLNPCSPELNKTTTHLTPVTPQGLKFGPSCTCLFAGCFYHLVGTRSVCARLNSLIVVHCRQNMHSKLTPEGATYRQSQVTRSLWVVVHLIEDPFQK